MLKFFFLFLFIFQCFYCSAQKDSSFVCGSDYSKLSKEEQKILDQIEKAYLSKRLTNVQVDSTSIYTIPVVFHVFHLGEPVGMGSNVSSAYIQNYVKKLNDGYRGRGNYFGKTPDTKIQFVLASRNPEGNFTNGIIRIDGRVVSGYEQNGIDYGNSATYTPLINLSQWDSKTYININIFYSISGAGAFAGYNGSLYMQIGNLDSFDGLDSIYIHEMGHSLNLYHTFEGDNNGNSCPVNTNPATDGDRILDTPPHIRYAGTAANSINSCTNQILGKVYNNFMSYSNYDTNIKLFSSGQIERMRGLSFEDLTRKELLNLYGLSEKNDSIQYCSATKPVNAASFAIITINNFFGKVYGNIHETKKNLGTIYVQAGQNYLINLNLSYYTTPNSVVRLYIDINRDGQFNEQSEVYFTSNTTYNISGSFSLPSNLEKYKTYRTRLLIAPNANSTSCTLVGIQPASTLYIGKTLDADLVVVTQTCNWVVPKIETTCQRIKKGDFAIIEAKNCINGRVYWFADSLKTILLAEGNRLFTPTLYANIDYYASCKINDCWGQTNKATVFIDKQLENYKIENKIINAGTTTTLTFENCNGVVKWYENESGGISIFTGNIFSTPILSQNVSYFAECLTLNQCMQKNRIIGKILVSSNDIVIKNSSIFNFCSYSSGTFFYPILSKNTATYSLYTVVFIKNNKLIYQSRLQPALLNNGSIDHFAYLDDSFFPESGTYEYYVTNGNKTSQKGTVNINKYFNASILINNLGVGNQQICNGSTTRLTCFTEYLQGILKNSSEFTYQWYKNNIPISNATQSFLDVNLTANYYVSVSNGGCNINSQNTSINVTNYVSYNILNSDYSQNELVCEGDTIRLNSAYATSNSSFKWLKDGVEILGLTTPSISVSKAGRYSVQVSDPNCISNPLSTSHKNIQFINEYNYTLSSPDTVICSNLNIWIYLSANSHYTIDYTIEWYKDDKLLSSGSMAYLDNRRITTRGGGRYYAIIKYKTCITKTNTINIVENTTFQKPLIQLGNISCGSATLTSTQYVDWYRNDVLLSQGYSLNINQTGVYKAKRNPISNSCEIYSEPLNISNLNTITTLAYTVSNKTNLCGNNDGIQLYTTYQNNYTYKWKKDNIEIPNAINSYYFASSPGVYECVISNGTCSNTTPAITITQSNNSGISLTASEQSIWCSDRAVKLTINGMNQNISSGVNWFKNGVQIPNVQDLSIFISESGSYTASVNQFGCSATAPPQSISYPKPIFNLIPSATVDVGQVANLTVQGCNGTVRWYKNYEDLEYISSGTAYLTPPLFQNSKYYVSCEEGNCLSNKIPVTIIVCNSVLNISNNVSSGTYKASDLIESNTNVPSNTVFQAAKKIILKPGFQAGANEVFEAVIGGCEN